MIKKIKLGAPKPPPKTNVVDEEAERLKRRAVELQALNLYLAGHDSAAIGEKLDPPVSALRAHQIVEKAIKNAKETAIGRIREREDMRLDAMSVAIWEQAMGYTDEFGVAHPVNLKAMSKLLEIVEMKAKFHGLNSPVEIKLRDNINAVLQVVEKHAPRDVFAKIIEELAEHDRAKLVGEAQAGRVDVSAVGGVVH